MALLLVIALNGHALADLSWHAPGWSHRAIVEIEKPGAHAPNIDTAAVRVFHAGLASANGDDYRVFDAAGNPVPYLLTYHHPARDTLISFRAPQATGAFVVYFGHKGAPNDPMAAIVDNRMGAGPPRPGPAAGGWIPHAGLTMVTMRRPPLYENEGPESPQLMQELIDKSPTVGGLDGGDYHRNISDGMNYYGDSDYYISVYRGWINIPAPGKYQFCTASNEASFSYINGQELVHWPGRHTEQRGKFGEKNKTHTLQAGLHYVEYYHEEVLLYQCAFLGWQPPGAGYFIAIGDDRFPQPHQAQVTQYESAGKPTVMLRPELLDNVWPKARARGQYTRYRFTASAGSKPDPAGGWSANWDFGDGQVGQGASVEHVYLKTGPYTVTMTATGPAGQQVRQTWPLVVFDIDHLAGAFRVSDIATYAPIVKNYDPAKLATGPLGELVRFQVESRDKSAAGRASQILASRTDVSGDDAAQAHLVLAGEAGEDTGVWSVEPPPADAEKHLRAALDKQTRPRDQVNTLARLIRYMGVNRADLDAAQALYAQAETLVKTEGLTRPMKLGFREASLAMGDARLLARQLDQAAEDYKFAEALAEPGIIPPQVRVAKIGAYPETIHQHLEAGRIDDAMAFVEQWRDEFPSDQVRGAVLFYLGKMRILQKQPQLAVKPLQFAIELSVGAEFEAEARWLIAQAYKELGDEPSSRAALTGLVKSGLGGEYYDKAMVALKQPK